MPRVVSVVYFMRMLIPLQAGQNSGVSHVLMPPPDGSSVSIDADFL